MTGPAGDPAPGTAASTTAQALNVRGGRTISEYGRYVMGIAGAG
ncbi:hypothetical protein ACFVFI_28265 [Streptomyces sp. NPDC057705]